jgi:hypothetical protein
MRFLATVVPDVVIDAAIIGSLAVGTVVALPRAIYLLLLKDGDFSEN